MQPRARTTVSMTRAAGRAVSTRVRRAPTLVPDRAGSTPVCRAPGLALGRAVSTRMCRAPTLVPGRAGSTPVCRAPRLALDPAASAAVLAAGVLTPDNRRLPWFGELRPFGRLISANEAESRCRRHGFCLIADEAVYVGLWDAAVLSDPGPLDRRVENPFFQPRVATVEH